MANGLSILQNTFLRSLKLAPKGILNITGSEFLFKVKEEWQNVVHPAKTHVELDYISEPFGRNTAAAIAMASLWVAQKYDEDEVVLVLPSDHLIGDEDAFAKTVLTANTLAKQGLIVTFGLKPTAAETGYSYIEHNHNEVKNFVEKPSREQAQEYLNSGNYLWNSGMFCFKAKTMLQEMELYCPDILAASKICFNASSNEQSNLMKIESQTFAKVREDSIDYAAMERSKKIVVVPCDIGWSDVGTWNAMSQLSAPDANGNVLNGDIISTKSKNCYIESNGRLIAALGVENLIVVDTIDALLIVDKNHVDSVKDLYSNLAKSGHHTHMVHTVAYRPWGSYTVLEEGNGFKIKRIEVTPGASLSLQSHEHRSEHWIVISGEAIVINDSQELLLSVNQSTYITAGSKHRLSNPSSSEKLVLIEVQTGNYLGEDDIQRFEDVYGRVV